MKSSVNLVSQKISAVTEVEIFYPVNSQQFLNDLGTDLTFCSAYHHSSNQLTCYQKCPKSDETCGTANKLWCILLLEYLATPFNTGLPSPAAMMGREFRGLLPHLQHFLPDSTKELLVQCHENQVHPGGHDLSDVPIGSNVHFGS